MKTAFALLILALATPIFAQSSNTASLQQVVTAPLIPATITLTSSPNPSLTTDTVTYSGKVTGVSGMPTGTVTVKDGALAVATVTLDATGAYVCQESNMTAGTHTITASYSGDKVYAPSK